MAGNDSDCVLLVHCDGADTSTDFEDDSIGGTTHTVTAYAGAQVDTAQRVFGTGSLIVEDDYLTIANHADFDFGTDDFCIDFRIRYDVEVQGNYTFGRDHAGGLLVTFEQLPNQLDFYVEGSRYQFDWDMAVDTWYHVALTRDGTDLKLFVDGTQSGDTMTSSDNVAGTGAFTIGGDDAYPQYGMTGWIDEFRVSKGVFRWNSNFTPPTEAYSVDTGTNLQMNVGDSWKEISAAQINIGDAWKDVAGMQINIGDSWKEVF